MGTYFPLLFWGGLFVLTVVLEVASHHLVSIWFAAGSLAALIAACFGTSFLVQALVFVGVSVLLLIFTRPILRKLLSFQIQNTNSREVGRIAVVIQAIDPVQGTGRVRLDGVDWIAVSQTGETIPEQTSVRVAAVDGSKLFVTTLPETVVTTS